MAGFPRLVTLFLHAAFPALVQVVLQGVAHIVVYASRGVGGHQFLTLCHHRQYAAVHRCGARIDVYALRLDEYLREVLGYATAYAVVLSLAHGGKVAQALLSGLVEYFQLAQYFLSLSRQLSLHACLAHGPYHTLVVILAYEPARAVTAIVREVEGHVALRSLRVVEVGQLAVVVQIVRPCQPVVLANLLAGCLCCGSDK